MGIRSSSSSITLALAGILSLSACVAGAPTGGGTGNAGGSGAGNSGGGSGGSGNNAGGSGGNTPPGDPDPVGAPPTVNATPVCEGDERPGPRRLRLLTRAEYAATVSALLFIQAPPVDNLPVESVVDGFNNNARAQVVTSRHIDEYLATGDRLAEQALTQSKGRLVPCAGAAGCDRTFVTAFGRRAFRRPLTQEEVQRYTYLFAPSFTGAGADAFDKGVRLTIQAILASPSFLYRSEVGERASDGTYKLTPFEIATAMSYLLTGSTPDDLLLDAAQNGQLGTPQGIETQARRLLSSPASRPAIAAFFRQWLGIDGFLYTNKDTAVYPGFTDDIRKAMVDEADTFVAEVVQNGKGTFTELFQADYLFASDTLARFYGLPGTGNPQPGRVTAPGGAARKRGGLMTLGALLGAHAHSNESSPVRRGVFVRQQLLCSTLTPPPENLNIMPPGLDPSLTTRARFQRHSSDPACASCHKLIDPLGFGFERYDGVGAYRETEAGMPIDSSGEVLGMESLESTDSVRFDGPTALGALIAASPNAQACFARQLFRYARGGENGTADGCAIKKLQEAFAAGALDVDQLFIEVLKQRSFTVRGGTP
jgi:hypothetical protein